MKNGTCRIDRVRKKVLKFNLPGSWIICSVENFLTGQAFSANVDIIPTTSAGREASV